MSTHIILPSEATAIAPDGSEVRVLLRVSSGGMAHFEFPPGRTSPAVRHKTVDELWFFVSGRGRMWTSEGPEGGFDVFPGVCVASRSIRAFKFGPMATNHLQR
jgi:mannose-6-phosphate isomerase-like protein (cupin superfamily)